MCGIAGYFAPRGIDPAEGARLLERLTGGLAHRGPDDHGTLAGEHCGLAATRLAIIDLAGGHMPIFNERRTVAVTYNGEIYNHRPLRERLAGAGHTFATRADTEVLVHLYEERGLDLCTELQGMFAFALWDSEKRRLVLARDRFGMKPLMIGRSDDGEILLFASEAKALFATGRITPRLDPAALRDCCSAGYPAPPRTMFRGIEQLPPASWRVLEVGKDAAETRRYWTMPYPEGAGQALAPATIDRAAEELRTLFDEVVREHLAADVKVGSYLSGGVDSVCVASRAAALLGADGPLHTYSMVFGGEDARFDESRFSDQCAADLRTEHRRLELSGISGEDYAGTIRAMEAPQVHTVAFCLYQLAREVRGSGLKVILSGEGSDEIFAGYGVFRLGQLRRTLGGALRPVRTALMRLFLGRRQPALARSLGGWWRQEPALVKRYGLVPPWIEQWWLLSEAAAGLFTPSGRALLASGPLEALPEIPEAAELRKPASALHRELQFEQRTRLDGWVLPLGDRLTMAHSVEARVPFLDHRIAELTARVPPDFLLRRMQEKRLLRHAMRDVLPEALRTRQKRAFMAPINGWLFGKTPPEYVRAALSPSALARTGLFDPTAIAAALALTAAGGRSYETLRASWALNLALGVEVLVRELGVGL